MWHFKSEIDLLEKFAMRIQTVYFIRIYQIRFTRIKRSHIETESVPIFEFTIVFSSI